MGWLHNIIDSTDMSLSKLWEMVKDRAACYAAVHGLQRVRHDSVTQQEKAAIQEGVVQVFSLQGHFLRKLPTVAFTNGWAQHRQRTGLCELGLGYALASEHLRHLG